MAEDGPRPLLIGISGASGAIYGVRLLEILRPLGIKTHLIISRAARATIAAELGTPLREIAALADASYSPDDMGAACSSGSFPAAGMIIAPCSVRTMSAIATGCCDTLISRAADVMLKERRRIVLMLRETPLHLGHLRNMAQVAELGGVIYPPVPAFYSRPASLEAMVDHTLGRVLDLFGIDAGTVTRWQGLADNRQNLDSRQ